MQRLSQVPVLFDKVQFTSELKYNPITKQNEADITKPRALEAQIHHAQKCMVHFNARDRMRMRYMEEGGRTYLQVMFLPPWATYAVTKDRQVFLTA